jgi:hypothetical protein
MPPKYNVKRLPFIPIGPSIGYVPLTQGQYALVDAEDVLYLAQWSWCAAWSEITQSFYAVTQIRDGGKSSIGMHRLLLNTPAGMQGDHIHHQTLDNRRSQIRTVTPQQNLMNRRRASAPPKYGIYGITKVKRSIPWVLRVGNKYVGRFSSLEKAIEGRRIYLEMLSP